MRLILAAAVYDLADALGFINVSGNVFSANGANLNLNKSVGEIFATGSNYDTAATNPHIKDAGSVVCAHVPVSLL